MAIHTYPSKQDYLHKVRPRTHEKASRSQVDDATTIHYLPFEPGLAEVLVCKNSERASLRMVKKESTNRKACSLTRQL